MDSSSSSSNHQPEQSATTATNNSTANGNSSASSSSSNHQPEQSATTATNNSTANNGPSESLPAADDSVFVRNDRLVSVQLNSISHDAGAVNADFLLPASTSAANHQQQQQQQQPPTENTTAQTEVQIFQLEIPINISSLYSPSSASTSAPVFFFFCQFCGYEPFSSLDDLRTHCRTAHSRRKPFKCKVAGCLDAFQSMGDAMSHLAVHHQMVPNDDLVEVNQQLLAREEDKLSCWLSSPEHKLLQSLIRINGETDGNGHQELSKKVHHFILREWQKKKPPQLPETLADEAPSTAAGQPGKTKRRKRKPRDELFTTPKKVQKTATRRTAAVHTIIEEVEEEEEQQQQEQEQEQHQQEEEEEEEEEEEQEQEQEQEQGPSSETANMSARNFGVPAVATAAAAAGARNNLTVSRVRRFSCAGEYSFEVEINADLAKLSAELILICPRCRHPSFETGADLLRHFRNSHSNRRPYRCSCPECKYSALLKRGIHGHLARAHRRSLVNELAEAVIVTDKVALIKEKRKFENWFGTETYTKLAKKKAVQRMEDADM